MLYEVITVPRIDNIREKIKYWIQPPDEAVFQPAGQAPTETAVSGTSPTRTLSPTPTQTLTPTVGPTLTPTITSTPLPDSVILKGIRYEEQHNRWNYCGPANLSMALNYVGSYNFV